MSERTQTRMTCTTADLEAWGRGIAVGELSDSGLELARTGVPSYPPCLGCGGPIRASNEGALVFDAREKTVTFRPCGCVLTVPDMEPYWESAES